MRNPKRIEILITKLKEVWVKNPDLRFTQLLIGIGLAKDSSLWHMEESEAINLIDSFKKKLEG